ncbi:hypothetical protein [Reticulibacter mediterranei]|uniref:hypothetical protein n=1 Tax=Reticulibacter mediterranei TaxID=2778369 RepID=UPI001C68E8C5|nr:hypothetical protein [Reticulibacter mediterranei]
MQKLLLVLSGCGPLLSFLLIIAAAFPLLPLLAQLFIFFAKANEQKVSNSHLFQFCLCALALLTCLIIGCYSLQASQSVVQLALLLGGIFGLVMGLLYCALIRRWGENLAWGLLLPLPLYLMLFVKEWPAFRPGRATWQIPLWPLYLQVSLMLIFAGYAFLVTWQTHSALIAFWSTLIATLILPLVVCNFLLLIDFATRLLEARPSSRARQTVAVLSRWTASIFIRSNRLTSPRLLNYIEDVPGLCLLGMSMLPSLLILALLGGGIGSFLL